MATPEVVGLPVGTPLYDIHNTFGAVYIGGLFSVGLLGMTIVQAWFYYDHFPKDPFWMKVVVLAICVVEILRSAFTSHAVYWYMVQNWGNLLGLNTVVWSLKSIIMTTNVSKFFGHLFFSWRIYILSPRGKVKDILTSMVVVITFFDFGAATSAFVNVLKSKTIIDYTQGEQKILSPFALATAMATDATLSICLIFVLSRSKGGFSRTNRLINSLIFYAIEVGIVTVLVGALSLSLNHFINNSNIRFDYIGVYAVSGNLYANSLIATLNARIKYKLNTDSAVNTTSLLRDEDSPHRDAFFKRRNAASPMHDQARREVHLQTFVTTSVEVVQDKKHTEGIMDISPTITRPEASHEP